MEEGMTQGKGKGRRLGGDMEGGPPPEEARAKKKRSSGSVEYPAGASGRREDTVRPLSAVVKAVNKEHRVHGWCCTGEVTLPVSRASPPLPFCAFESRIMNTAQGTVGSDPVILATAGYDHTVRFWQAHSGICTRTVQHQDSQVNALEITPDRSMIAAAGYQHIRMYDLNSNNPNPVINYDGVSKNITSVGFHEDGRWMYTGGEDCMARIWDLRSRNLQCQRIFQVNAPINCVCLHPNQAELIVGDQSGAIHIWDLKTDHNEQLIPEPEVSVNSVHIDPDASYMAAVNSSGNCYVWNLTGGIGDEVTQLIPKTKIPAHNRYALQCKFSPDSTLLATCSADQTCKIWRTSNFSLMTELSIKSNNPGETSRGWMWDCAFSGDSQYIVTASSDNLARLWCVESGEIKREYSGHQKAVVCLAFNDSVLG
ncbi:target of rapamycin complex subunit LST8 isoform X1 [Hemicordylus capensis]|uniref:target of rapamycin complex subunit LST8 isoform X1 n=2 Tax=Hemicordylus capensis TaxID=884348 RepID=UPI002302F9C7|nr:target of rapamycin complex subunit LST8 isoform X1 [Hemicordylus capensis]